MVQQVTRIRAVFVLVGLAVLVLLGIWNETIVMVQPLMGVIRSINNDTLVARRLPSPETSICRSYNGILFINHGDQYAAAGTLFFVVIINHLIFAEQNDLLPWIHIGENNVCYDASVHGRENTTVSSVWRGGATIQRKTEPRFTPLACVRKRKKLRSYPAGVEYNNNRSNSVNRTNSQTIEDLILTGNGIWSTYFEEPVPSWRQCRSSLPLVELAPTDTEFGLHYCAPWAVRPWPLVGLPQGLRPIDHNASLDEWYRPMRERAEALVQRYYHPHPWLTELVEEAMPPPLDNNNKEKNKSWKCMSMHIRMTDKGHGRVKQPLSAFQAYAEVYANQSQPGFIYVATDDGRVVEEIQANWTLAKGLVRYQPGVQRSRGDNPIFAVYPNKAHRTNTEALVDIYAMSKCQVLVHGFSAMAEAALYLNRDLLSVNLDDPHRTVTPQALQERFNAP